MDAIVHFAHEFLLTPDAELFGHLMVFVRQQGEVKHLFFGKARQFFRLIGADPQNIDAKLFQIRLAIP